jgi:subtilisin-like proprotein convertase family protein
MTINPGTCENPSTALGPTEIVSKGANHTGLIISLIAQDFSSVAKVLSIEVAISATYAGDVEIVMVAPSRSMYTILSSDGGNGLDMGDESGNPGKYTFASRGVPFGSVVIGTGTDDDLALLHGS